MSEIGRDNLGSSDLEVSQLAFGTYRFYYKDTSLAIPLMGNAFEQGVNFFDTSDNYIVAEELLGDAIRLGALPRDEIVIATKTGLATSYEEHQAFNRKGIRQDTSPQRVKHQAEKSLRALGIEAIDLYQIHIYDPQAEPEETAGTMNDLITEGKIKHWGVANYNSAQEVSELLAVCDENNLVRPISLQVGYNLVNRFAKNAIEFAQTEGLGVMAFSPLDTGRLTNVRLMGRAAVLDNKVTHSEDEAYELSVIEEFIKLEELAALKGHNLQRLSIAWLMSRPGIVPILGAYNQDHLDDLLQASDWQLGSEELALIDKVSSRIAT